LEAGFPPQALLDGRLLVTGVVVQSAIALVLAVLLTLAGRAAEAVGRALRRPARPRERAGRPLAVLGGGWPGEVGGAGRHWASPGERAAERRPWGALPHPAPWSPNSHVQPAPPARRPRACRCST